MDRQGTRDKTVRARNRVLLALFVTLAVALYAATLMRIMG
jgi:hypothetical protein